MGCPRIFAGMSRTPGGVQKFVQKSLCAFFVPYLSIYLSFYLSFYLSLHLCIYLSIYLSIYIYACCEVTNWATFGHF